MLTDSLDAEAAIAQCIEQKLAHATKALVPASPRIRRFFFRKANTDSLTAQRTQHYAATEQLWAVRAWRSPGGESFQELAGLLHAHALPSSPLSPTGDAEAATAMPNSRITYTAFTEARTQLLAGRCGLAQFFA